MGECRECHNEAERVRRSLRRWDHNDKLLASFVNKIKNAKTNDRVALVSNLMIQSFGGVQGLVDTWTEQINRVLSEKPGSKKALDFFLAIMRMIEFCDANRPDVSELSDEDLQREAEIQLRQLIQSHPEIAVHAAAEIGWTVIPPDEADQQPSVTMAPAS
jgi:hypothetical protein